MHKIVAIVRAHGENMPVKDFFIHLHFAAGPFAGLLLYIKRRRHRIADLKLTSIVVTIRGSIQRVRKLVRVFQGGVAAVVHGARSRVVEGRQILRGGISLFTVDVCAFEGEVLVAHRAEETAEAVVIHFMRNAVVLRWRVEFLVEQIVRAIAAVNRARKQELQAVGELVAERYAAGIGVETSIGTGGLDAVHLSALAGEDVDHAEESVVTVKHGTRAADDFDTVNQVNVQNERRVNERAVVQVVVDALAVDEEQNAAVEIAEVDAARAQKSVVAVVGNVKTLYAGQNVGQRPVAVALDFVGRDDRGGRRRLGGFLFKF